jgi:hypothetical protein
MTTNEAAAEEIHTSDRSDDRFNPDRVDETPGDAEDRGVTADHNSDAKFGTGAVVTDPSPVDGAAQDDDVVDDSATTSTPSVDGVADSTSDDDVPVTAGPVVTATPADPTVSAGTATAGPSGTDDSWHDLQGRFVDDPEAVVKEAGALVEQDLATLRGRLESGDTENLRTAFRRYRDLHASLS